MLTFNILIRLFSMNVKLDPGFKVFFICSQPEVAENFVRIGRCLQMNEKIRCAVFAMGDAYPAGLEEASNQLPTMRKVEIQKFNFESLINDSFSPKIIKNIAKQIADYFHHAQFLVVESGLKETIPFFRKACLIFSKEYPGNKQLFFSPGEKNLSFYLNSISSHFKQFKQNPVKRNDNSLTVSPLKR